MSSTENAPTEFLIVGAGALGSILGAHLGSAGYRVTMLARGARAAAIAKAGIRIEGLTTLVQPVQVITDATQIRNTEILIIATKAIDTVHTVSLLKHIDLRSALSIQNGVFKNEALSNTFGSGRVLGAVADISGELRPDGTVIFTRNIDICLGRLQHNSDEAASAAATVARELNHAGIKASTSSDIQSLEWSKFVGWVGLLTVAVTLRAPTSQCLADPAAALVLVRIVREMGSLCRAEGVKLQDGAVLPVATLCQGTEDSAVDRVLAVGNVFARMAPEHRISALQDLEAERPLEINETIGYAVARAHRLALKLPLLETVLPLITAIDRVASAKCHS
jgi:2-dehydropantoate 2-reductase